MEPPGTAGSDQEALDLLRVKLAGAELRGEGETKTRTVLVPLGDETKVVPFYCRSAQTWQTVTPVVLHGYNTARHGISLVKTDRLLCQGFDAAGIPEALLREATFQAAPYWPGCGSAGGVRVPRHLERWPRLHVRIHFTEAVRGPVLAGLGRHCGVGVFAAEGD